MLLKLNSGLAGAILCLYVLGFLVGAPIIHILQLQTSGVSTITPEGQWIYSIYFVLEYLDHIIVALWLLLNVPRFKEDTLTWLLCGMAFGVFAIPLFVAVMLFQRSYGVKLRTSFSSLMLILLPYYAALYAGDYIFSHYDLVKVPVEWRIDKVAAANMVIYFGGLAFIMNVVLALFLLRLLKGKDRSWLWGLSTLVLGAGPAIIKLMLLIYFRKRVAVREMSSSL
jgi:hypothetical protein